MHQLPPPLPPTFATGHASIRDARRAIEGIAGLAHSTLRAMAAAPLQVPWFEAKVAIGLHIEVLANFFVEIEQRRLEIARGANPVLAEPDERLASFENLSGAATLGQLASMQHDLVSQIEGHLQSTNPVLDYPTVRILTRALRELRQVRDWHQEAHEAVLGSGGEHRVSSLSRSVGSATRRTSAMRDTTPPTFSNTRDYRTESDQFTGNEYADHVLELAWVNRDEIDAIETFGLVLFDLLPEIPLEMINDLGRFCADEARHAWIGRDLIEAHGLCNETLPVSTIGIDVRAQMSGWQALTQITMFGELGIIGPMRQLAKDARKNEDWSTCHAFEFISSDELQHLRRSTSWIASAHPAGSLDAAEEDARRCAAKLLASEGVVGEDYYLQLSKREIFEMLGE